MLHFQEISATHRDSIFSQSSMPKIVWDLAVTVMDLFEKAKLKDQKLRSSSTNAKPDFKQQYLAPIRCLELNDQCSLLERCKNGSISLKEMKNEAENFKKMYTLKKAFVKLTNAKNWEDAFTHHPRYATESQLKKFITLDVSKGIPQPFVDFCKHAKSYASCDESAEVEMAAAGCVLNVGDVIAVAIHAEFSELTGHMISSMYKKFSGADLILLLIKEVTVLCMQCISYVCSAAKLE